MNDLNDFKGEEISKFARRSKLTQQAIKSLTPVFKSGTTFSPKGAMSSLAKLWGG